MTPPNNTGWGIDLNEGQRPSLLNRLRATAAAFVHCLTSSPTGWRCSRCGGTDSMFESLDPEDPTVEICKRCGHKVRY